MNKRPHDSASVSALQAGLLIALPAVVIALALVTKSFGTNSEIVLEDRVANPFTLRGVGPSEPTPPPSPTVSPSPTPTAPPATPTPVQHCPTVVTQSFSQSITAGNSASCNGGGPDFFHADTSYWRAFELGSRPPNEFFAVLSVSFGIQSAAANPPVGIQPVTVRLHAQTNGVFPAGTWTEFAASTIDLENQSGSIFTVPLVHVVPPGTTRLIMEVFTPDGRAPVNNSFFIGSNAAGQGAPSYISASACGLSTPTDLAAIGYPNMHIVFSISMTCIVGDPTPSPAPSGTPSASPTPTATEIPVTPTPTATATLTPVPVTHAINLSTRMRVGTGENAGIGGFIVTGTGSKAVLLRAIGPSLVQFGLQDALADPFLRLRICNNEICIPELIDIINDNWRDTQEAEVIATGIPPGNDLESAIAVTLPPGPYTATVTGNGNTSGVALVEIYDLDPSASAKLANLSTRAFVGTGDDVVIAGFILAGNTGNDHVIVRGLGPSLADAGVENALSDPTLQLRDGNGELIIADNNWQDDPDQAAQLMTAGLAPGSPLESGVSAALAPGSYTVLLAGLDNVTGVGLIEIYDDLSIGEPSPSPTPSAVCAENFDTVKPPVLPAGWRALLPGGGVTWVTSSVSPDTAPNDLFVTDTEGLANKFVDRTAVLVTSTSPIIAFRNNFKLGPGDGGVLEVSAPNIGSGGFLDFTDLDLGGSFISGGYNSMVGGRAVWSGNSGGYIDTVANLGPHLNGQTITVRLRMTTDTVATPPEWRIDTFSITGASCP